MDGVTLLDMKRGKRRGRWLLNTKLPLGLSCQKNQIKAWETHYGSMNNGEGLRGIMKDDYDNRLDQLEAKFEKIKGGY